MLPLKPSTYGRRAGDSPSGMRPEQRRGSRHFPEGGLVPAAINDAELIRDERKGVTDRKKAVEARFWLI